MFPVQFSAKVTTFSKKQKSYGVKKTFAMGKVQRKNAIYCRMACAFEYERGKKHTPNEKKYEKYFFFLNFATNFRAPALILN